VQYDVGAMDDAGKDGPWSATTWCRGELAYHQCDHEDNVSPPDPPLLKDLRNPD
jgi:hypothetical protein